MHSAYKTDSTDRLRHSFYSQMKAKDKKKLLEYLNMEKYFQVCIRFCIRQRLSFFFSFTNPTDIPVGVSANLSSLSDMQQAA